jgi:hypothetical protein
MTQNVGTYDEAVSGSKQKFFSVSLLLKGIQQSKGVRFLKMKTVKSTHPSV